MSLIELDRVMFFYENEEHAEDVLSEFSRIQNEEAELFNATVTMSKELRGIDTSNGVFKTSYGDVLKRKASWVVVKDLIDSKDIQLVQSSVFSDRLDQMPFFLKRAFTDNNLEIPENVRNFTSMPFINIHFKNGNTITCLNSTLTQNSLKKAVDSETMAHKVGSIVGTLTLYAGLSLVVLKLVDWLLSLIF